MSRLHPNKYDRRITASRNTGVVVCGVELQPKHSLIIESKPESCTFAKGHAGTHSWWIPATEAPKSAQDRSWSDSGA